MIPAIVMPLTGWMFSVSLPVIRDDLAVDPDIAAWIATAFTLVFMILMPVYGRISDGLGKRRLLLWGLVIFAIGAVVATMSASLPMLIVGRAIQGFGISGMVPLTLALITESFPPGERGKAMGLWSTIGPLTGVIGPLLAGYVVARYGWRASFIPPIFFALISFIVIYLMIPSTGRPIQIDFLKAFDWGGVGLLAVSLTFLLFFLSSRPITGVAPLQDWRLGVITVLFFTFFILYERRQEDPFIRLNILNNRGLVIGSFSACMRMIGLSGGFGFLMPLYLADVFALDARFSGFVLMVGPGAMALVVRIAGGFADRWGSRGVVMTGFTIFGTVFYTLSRLDGTQTPLWVLVGLIAFFGMGAGLMLASLHRAALNDVSENDVGTASGIYSMIRFLGSALGAAVGGILLKRFLDQTGADSQLMYQLTYRWFVAFAGIGLLTALWLPGPVSDDR